MTPDSESSTIPKARVNELPLETCSNIAEIHFKIDHIYGLSISSTTQTVAPMRPQRPLNINGDLKITFVTVDYDLRAMRRTYEIEHDRLIEFFYLILYTAMELEQTGPKEINEVKDVVVKIFAAI
ncbi:hypothetical protein TI39_contig52g00005 [Zymoseptoria brevis]|uniref:Uncharacterized protein n=1 Tax=Zymoseptoria brevis TaxID=1047168 RepID=A0A0F4GYW9_9PEZI|nr:hypothetical protein TI39_contig52g00005 [Zymoseptoria brevis]